MSPQSPAPNSATGTCSTNILAWITGGTSPYPPLCLCTWMSCVCVCGHFFVGQVSISAEVCVQISRFAPSLWLPSIHPNFAQSLVPGVQGPMYDFSLSLKDLAIPPAPLWATGSQVPRLGAQQTGPWAPSGVHSKKASQGGILFSVH